MNCFRQLHRVGAKVCRVTTFSLLITLLSILIPTPSLATAQCGMIFQRPQGPMPGVDDVGRALKAIRLGELKFGDADNAESFPIFAKFSPKYKKPQQLFGVYWLIPFFESNIVQLDELNFLAEMPDGWTRSFYRATAGETILRESGGWVGEISGKTIVLSASCGWKITYYEGNIASIDSPKGNRLSYRYNADEIVGISEGGTPLVQLERVHKPEEELEISIRGATPIITCSFVDSPLISEIGNQRVVANVERSVGVMGPIPGGQTISINYNPSDQLIPTAKFFLDETIQEAFSWDPGTCMLIGLNDWRYEIVRNDRYETSEFKRQKPGRGLESWLKSTKYGIEIVNDGQVITTRKYFVSGPAGGKVRSLIRSNGGKVESELRFYYDERGRLVRKSDNGIVTQYQDGPESNTSWAISPTEADYEARLLNKIKVSDSDSDITNVYKALRVLYASQGRPKATIESQLSELLSEYGSAR